MFKFLQKTTIVAGLALVMTLGLGNQAKAQLDQAGEILRGGVDDANLILNEYLRPFGSSFGASLNTGWNHMARPHRLLGFSVSLRVGATLVPDDAGTFDLSTLGLKSIEPKDPNNTIASTFAGPGTALPVEVWARNIQIPGGGTTDIKLTQFDLPPGIGDLAGEAGAQVVVPSVMAQVAIGLFKDTEIGIRYMPELDYASFGLSEDLPQLSLLGVNFKHGLNQWIPGGGAIPVDIVLQAAYTSFNISTNIAVSPDAVASNPSISNPTEFAASHWAGQKFEFDATSYTVNILVGKNLPLIRVHAGIGIESSTVSLATRGNYPLIEPDPTVTQPDRVKITTLVDPLNLSFDGENNTRIVLGATISLGPIKIPIEYTQSTYSTLNVGVAFGIR